MLGLKKKRTWKQDIVSKVRKQLGGVKKNSCSKQIFANASTSVRRLNHEQHKQHEFIKRNTQWDARSQLCAKVMAAKENR